MFANKSNNTSFGGGFNFGANTQQQQQQQPPPQQQPTTSIGSTTQTTINPPTSNINSSTNIDITASLNNTDSNKLLRDLLDSASSLPKSSIGDQIGSIHLTLNELERKTQELRKSELKQKHHTKAHYLLADAGVKTGDLEDELNRIQLPKSSKHESNHNLENNIENYLKNKKEENILNTIEQTFNLASQDFDKYINSNISIDWKIRKEKLQKAIGLKDSSKFQEEALKCSVVWKSNSASANILTPLSTSPTKITRTKFEHYARIIYSLNEARLENQNFPLCLNFYDLNKFQDDFKSKQIAEIWKILQNLVDEKNSKTSQEQKFFKNPKLNDIIVSKSKEYLEWEFLNFVDHTYIKVVDKPKNFIPATNVNKVSFFIHQIILKNEPDLVNKTLLVNGVPIWALIYYLMRAGLYEDADNLVYKNRQLFNKFDKNFPIYIKNFVENSKLSSDLLERIHQEFNQQFQYILNDLETNVNYDPYKYSVYKIIGKCDLNNKSPPPSINLSNENWLWFQSSIINEDSSEESSLIFENYSLKNLQNKIVSLGPKYFLSSSNNPLYLKTLILSGLYELAVQYCYENMNEADAVHLAIGLAYFGLLNCSNFNKDGVLSVVNNEYEINYSRILGAYTTFFKLSDPKVACEYLILIALGQGGKSKSILQVCHDALRELLLVSREFGILIGELNQITGVIEPGVLETQRKLIGLEDLNSFHRQIVLVTANKCEEEGRIFDALLLYQLSCDYETTIVLINKLLSELISTSDLNKPIILFGNCDTLYSGSIDINSKNTIDNNIILLSEHIWQNFSKNSHILSSITSQVKQTCEVLISVIEIRNIFIQRNWSEVIDKINKLKILPANSNDNLSQIKIYSELIENNELNEDIIKIIPSLLILVLTCVTNLNYNILSQRYQSLNNEKDEILHWRKIAKNCIIYAGMVQYKMPREVYSLLINLESSL
ncbi:NIC96 [Candida pseudojiufengensis]|uniref:NIC96 n=1 Tax=Candida pseudojiufengensis TaxID=497109 RepID=UPI0022257146|nr:NIC96 [Candida pseudojiufengensis]KAI5960652.1 NIC96 [Candida pseudojiufengensis]